MTSPAPENTETVGERQRPANDQAEAQPVAGAPTIVDTTAVARIRAARQRLDAARYQLDHAEVEVTGEPAQGVARRLAAARALLRGGHRLLGAVIVEAEDSPAEAVEQDFVDEALVDVAHEQIRGTTIQRENARQRL